MKSKNKRLTVLLIILFWSCEQTDFDLQTPPDKISIDNADYDLVITSILDQFCREVQEELFLDLGRTTRYFFKDDEVYLEPVSNDYLNYWTLNYDFGKDIKLVEDAAENDESLVFHRGIARVIKVFGYAGMVDLFGDVPYTQTLDPTNIPHPAVDSGSDIYDDLYRILDLAQEDFKKAVELQDADKLNHIPESADLIYKGDIESWMRMGNSLKLRLLVQTRLVNPEFSKTEINALLEADSLIGHNEDFQYEYGSHFSPVAPSGHSGFESYTRSVPRYLSNHFIYSLKQSKIDEGGEPIKDPRIRYYLYRQTDEINLDAYGYCWDADENQIFEGYNYCFLGDAYYGGDTGAASAFSSGEDGFLLATIAGAYPVGGAADNNQAIENNDISTLEGMGINPIMLSSFVHFYKAEAALTLGTSGNPATYLQQGIEESIEKVMEFTSTLLEEFRPSNADVQLYIDAVMQAFDSAPNDDEKLRIIIDEFYLAAWGSPLEIYNAYRRTGHPSFPPPVGNSLGDFPRSISWPKSVVEDNRSFNNTNKPITQKVFWDTNPSDFIH